MTSNVKRTGKMRTISKIKTTSKITPVIKKMTSKVIVLIAHSFMQGIEFQEPKGPGNSSVKQSSRLNTFNIYLD